MQVHGVGREVTNEHVEDLVHQVRRVRRARRARRVTVQTGERGLLEDAEGVTQRCKQDAEFEVEAAAYASGVIDIDEFGRSVRARNGVA